MNLYYNPEKLGLRTIGEVEFSSGCYEFDLTVVWQDVETGALYYADDSGCSCPAPFEIVGRADLTRIESWPDLQAHLAQRIESVNYRFWDTDDGRDPERERLTGECGELVAKVRAVIA